MLKKTYVRNGKNRVIGLVTTGFEGSFEALVRDENESILGPDERAVSHYSGRAWQPDFNQHRRPWIVAQPQEVSAKCQEGSASTANSESG